LYIQHYFLQPCRANPAYLNTQVKCANDATPLQFRETHFTISSQDAEYATTPMG